MNTSVLLIPNHPAKAANALILARKLAALAQEQGLRAEVSALADAAAGDFSRIVFVGQLPDQLGAFPADTLWSFRVASLLSLATLWGGIGVLLTGMVGKLYDDALATEQRKALAASL